MPPNLVQHNIVLCDVNTAIKALSAASYWLLNIKTLFLIFIETAKYSSRIAHSSAVTQQLATFTISYPILPASDREVQIQVPFDSSLQEYFKEPLNRLMNSLLPKTRIIQNPGLTT